jgi:hypothetical protein
LLPVIAAAPIFTVPQADAARPAATTAATTLIHLADMTLFILTLSFLAAPGVIIMRRALL